jgi:hypothetical protein
MRAGTGKVLEIGWAGAVDGFSLLLNMLSL